MKRSIDQAIQARPPRPVLIIPLTVILELESVLRAFYRIDAVKIVQVLKHLWACQTSTPRSPSKSLRLSFSSLAQGVDFSDALHMLACSDCETLYSVDNRRFTRRAQLLGAAWALIVLFKNPIPRTMIQPHLLQEQ
ncbi:MULTISPECIES: type II toxin-antitoxin system VapC family toxin [unclassified Thiocapsa]|uniref:type II toxin-antitoxin system VapC family toxin n=1 Tax=unclassified Thiocapsa TaxID=2641286 RepID=UPI0035B4C213